MKHTIRILIIVITGIFSLQASGRFAEVSEADAERRRHYITCDVQETAAYRCEYEQEIRILNESGRDRYDRFRRIYNPRTTRLQVLAAAVTNDGRREAVAPKDIVDEEAPSGHDGFEKIRQVSIGFPNVRIGSVIYLKYQAEVMRPAVDGHFSMIFAVGDGIVDQDTRIRINTRRPLYHSLHDPQGAVTLRRELTTKGQRLSLSTRMPLFRKIVDEDNVVDDKIDLTTLEVSTSYTPEALGRALGQKFAEKIDITGSILTALGLVADELVLPAVTDTFDAVTAALSERFRYFGDWRAEDGAYVPRSLKEIIAKGYGDCKDLALLLTVILRELGFDAKVAIINRQEERPRIWSLAHLSDYNHAIVYVRHGGRDYWLDPTNRESFATGTPEDPAGRYAVTLDPLKSEEIWIPELVPAGNQLTLSHEILASEAGVTTVNARLDLSGVFAAYVTGLEADRSRSQAEQSVVKMLTQKKQLLAIKDSTFNLKSSVVRKQSVTATLEFADYFIDSDQGRILRLSNSVAAELLALRAGPRVSSFKLATPSVITQKVRIPRSSAMDRIGRRCQADSAWLTFDRRVIKDEETVEFVTRTTVKVIAIPAEDLQSEEFLAFQRELRGCALPDAVMVD